MKKEKSAKNKYNKYSILDKVFYIFERLFISIMLVSFGVFVILIYYDKSKAMWSLVLFLASILFALICLTLSIHFNKKATEYRSAYIEAFINSIVEENKEDE